MHPDPLRAWARALPLAHPSAFREASTLLPSPSDPELIEHVRVRALGRSLKATEDLLTSCFDRTSRFGGSPDVLAHLARWSGELFEDQGDALRLRDLTAKPGADASGHDGRGGCADALAIERYRWASLAVPVDVLAAAHPSHGEHARYVDAAPAALRRLFADEPVASTHQHLSAARPFAAMWCAALASKEIVKPAADVWKAGGDGNWVFESAEVARYWLAAASFARLGLARALARGATSDEAFRESLDATIDLAATLVAPTRAERTVRTLRRAIMRLGRPTLLPLPTEADCEDLDEAHRALITERSHHAATSGDALLRWVAPGALYGRASSPEEDEAIFLRRAFVATREPQGKGTFARLFLQLLRVRTLFFRWLTMEPGTSGLGWFTKHFARLDAVGGGDPTVREACALTRGPARARLRLASLEIRRTAKRPGVEQAIRELERLGREEDIETAVVVHLLKRDADPHPLGQPNASVFAIRYGAWLVEQAESIDALGASLADDPRRLIHLRGFDIANNELAVPTWCTAALFRRARAATVDAVRQLALRAPDVLVPPVRFTAHVGEDFRSLHEGLRRIDETIRSGAVGRGDRVGHALAVGVDPRGWASAGARLLQPREERIADLAWELGLYTSQRLQPQAGREEIVRRRIRVLLGQEGPTTGLAVTPDQLAALHEELLHWSLPAHAASPSQRLDALARDPSLSPLAKAYLQRTPELDLVPVPVDESEIRFLTDARELVLAALAHHGITIEMNPSSNLIIADLPGFERHPARLFRSVDRDGARVGVTIADDDPITFATNLRDEHAYAYAHVRTAGCSVEDAVAWVRDAMRAGMAARFSLGGRLGEPEGGRERGASGAPHGAGRADRRRAGP